MKTSLSQQMNGAAATGTATLRALALAGTLAVAACGPLRAATLRVDQSGGDHTTIQAALAAAASGDTVLVAAGVYTGPANRDLDFTGKAIVLASEPGPAQTVIDCERLGRAFRFHTGETGAAAVIGFTIANGESAERGGGILCEGASPRIENCVISGCVTGAGSATGYGGGVYCSNSALALTDCVLTGNTADEGAAMYAADSSPALTRCRVVANAAVRGGGGIRILRGGSGARLTGCTIAGNSAATYGGGIYCCYSAPVITNCTIVGNAASNGGAVYGYDASPTITNTILAFSTTGAAVYCPGASAFTITHSCSFGNAGGDSLCGTHHDNVFVDPAFCDTTAGSFTVNECSPCAGAGAGGADIGAWGIGCPCGGTGVPEVGTGGAARLEVFPNPARGPVLFVIETGSEGADPEAVTIHDLRGRLVRRIALSPAAGGLRHARWDGRDASGADVPHGVYFARAGSATGSGSVGKLVVLR